MASANPAAGAGEANAGRDAGAQCGSRVQRRARDAEHYWTARPRTRNNFRVEAHALASVAAGAHGFLLATREARLCVVCVVVLVCVAFCPPVPSLAIALARVRSRLSFAPRARGEQPGTSRARLVLGAVLPITAAWALIAHAAPIGKLLVDALAPYVAFAAMGAAADLVSGPTALGARLREAGAYLVAALVVGCVFAIACALGGTRSVATLVDAQGAWPWQWALFQRPALFAAFVLYVGHAGRMLALPECAGVLVHGAQPLGRLVVCGLGACVFLGGWRWPVAAATDPDVARSLGAAAFVAKAWLLAALVDVAHRAGVGRRGVTASGFMLTLALGAVAIVAPPTAAMEAGVGLVSFVTLAIVLALSVLALARSSHPMGEGPTHAAPFA